MKKVYTTRDYKSRHNRRCRLTKRRKKKKYLQTRYYSLSQPSFHDVRAPVIAPRDLRLIDNPEDCLLFFAKLRNKRSWSRQGNLFYVQLRMDDVQQIDYASISILKAITDDLAEKGIDINGIFPQNEDCKKFMTDSGFLHNMQDENGQPFPPAPKSDMIFFAKGSGKLMEKDIGKIGQTVHQVIEHLTGKPQRGYAIIRILLEICGNAIEWAGPDNKQWLLGIKYEEEKVIFTLTDIGKGILETLHRKFSKKFTDTFLFLPRHNILKGAFIQKYGSSSQEANRNKGLPDVKRGFDAGVLLKLKVITNNVILHFDNDHHSRTFRRKRITLHGTCYQWEMTVDCLPHLIKLNYEEIEHR